MMQIYRFFLWMIVFHSSMGFSSQVFNLTLTMPTINKTMTNQSIYVAIELPIGEELYIVDFNPIYDRQQVHFLTTYLCARPFTLKENFWFDHQPCRTMDRSMIIHEWYYNIPAIQWPKDAGFRVGINTPYRYIVIRIQYFSVVINDVYGQQLIMTRKKPKYKIGTVQLKTNPIDFQKHQAPISCRYQSLPIEIFSTRIYSNNGGRSISLYRMRSHQLEPIIKGNLQWPQTFYQSENSIDIKTDDFLIGNCVYKNRPLVQYNYDDLICQITIMFSLEEDDEMPMEACRNIVNPRIVQRFLPIDANIPPETLFDINPTYPKLTPDQWAIMNINRSISDNTSLLFLTNSTDKHDQKMIDFIRTHKLLFLFSLSGSGLLIGLIILIIVIIRSRKNKRYLSNNSSPSRTIHIGGESSTLSGWLTNRRFQEYDQYNNNNNNDGANEPLKKKHRWASSGESELSDNDIFDTTDFRNVRLKN